MNGERKSRNGAETKETVLSIAAKVFADKGFNGSSLAMVSEASGISVGLILHHYGSKEELYRAVLCDIAERYRAALLASAEEATVQGEDVAAAALESIFRFWASDEAYARISLWSCLEGRSGLDETEAAASLGLAGELRKLQSAGAADARFDPQVLLAMAIGPIHFWNRNREAFRARLRPEGGAASPDEEFLRQYKSLMMKLFAPASSLTLASDEC
jgi:AcrR family transcriptional regulator